MKKKSGDIFELIKVDPITGEYYISIPEQIINDLSWYEDTEVHLKVEGGELVISEREDN
jgi:hypothetical protein